VTAKALLELIKRSGPSDSGKFINLDGTEIDW